MVSAVCNSAVKLTLVVEKRDGEAILSWNEAVSFVSSLGPGLADFSSTGLSFEEGVQPHGTNTGSRLHTIWEKRGSHRIQMGTSSLDKWTLQ